KDGATFGLAVVDAQAWPCRCVFHTSREAPGPRTPGTAIDKSRGGQRIELINVLRNTDLFDQGGRGHHVKALAGDPARDEAVVTHEAKTQADVDFLVHHIRVLVAQVQIEADLW